MFFILSLLLQAQIVRNSQMEMNKDSFEAVQKFVGRSNKNTIIVAAIIVAVSVLCTMMLVENYRKRRRRRRKAFCADLEIFRKIYERKFHS
jgi:hypothetical protein